MSTITCIRIVPTLLKHSRYKYMTITKLWQNNSQVVLASCTQNIRLFATQQQLDGRIQVYHGILSPQIRAVKIFSLLTSLTGIMAQPFLYKEVMALGNVPLMIAMSSCLGFFTLVTPFLLHYITKKYVASLYYKPDTGKYVATTYTFFNRSQEMEFTPEDVKVPDVPGMFTSFLVKNKPLFVEPRLFEDPTHYGRIMGYDKPFDLKAFQSSLKESNK